MGKTLVGTQRQAATQRGISGRASGTVQPDLQRSGSLGKGEVQVSVSMLGKPSFGPSVSATGMIRGTKRLCEGRAWKVGTLV